MNGKIFCIGLSRTGTASITFALKELGFKIIHNPIDQNTRRKLMVGEYKLKILKKNDGLSDMQAAAFYPMFDRCYPRSKFILTTRSKEGWIKSIKRHMLNHDSRSSFDMWEFSKIFFRTASFGCATFSEERMSYVWDKHHKDVEEYFKNRQEDFLILDIRTENKWKPLCDFLGIKNIPTVDYPIMHQRSEDPK